ncbi:hypothetical protein [Clostridium oceanicum]|uniref:Lipoprotein n=1 Tax=Clostridium oceanicum TaxID=1543 RepID=A0ABP3UGT3_9CLOT
MKRKLTLLVILSIFLLSLTGCIIKNESSAHYTLKKGSKITDTYDYTVEDNFKGMKLKINLILTKGKVKFTLKDPEGNIQWSETVTSNKPLKETKKFNKKVGKWTLKFENINKSGEGKLNLQFNRL